MTTALQQTMPITESGATTVKVVELSRGVQNGWSMSNLFSLAGDFISGHILLIVFIVLALAAITICLALRKHGSVGAAGVMLLAGLALRGHFRSIKRIVRQSRTAKISIAAAALADG